jgi:site-specific recombinase XerD
MTKLSYSIKFFVIPSRAKAGKYPIYCRITVNRKKVEFALNDYVDPKKWNEEDNTVKASPELKSQLLSIESDLDKARKEILDEGEIPTAKAIKDKYLRTDEKSVKLIDYVTQYVDQVEQLTEYSKSTWKKYQTVKHHLAEFLKDNQLQSITLKGFNSVKIHEFELYLKTTAKLSVNTTTKYLKLLKTIYGRAIKFGLTNKNPFDGQKFKHERTNREFLTQEELESLETTKIANDSLNRVRNLFLFSCFSGLRFTDVGRLSPKNIIKDKSGKEWIEVQEIQKTGDFHRIPLLNKAKQIIEQYKDEAEITGQLLPLRSNQKVNAYLKVVADLCGIEKHLTFHMARHTFATTVTLSNNIPIEVVSKMLGHKNMATTQIYAKITNQYMQTYADLLNEKL